jgi:hypothetical protein
MVPSYPHKIVEYTQKPNKQKEKDLFPIIPTPLITFPSTHKTHLVADHYTVNGHAWRLTIYIIHQIMNIIISIPITTLAIVSIMKRITKNIQFITIMKWIRYVSVVEQIVAVILILRAIAFRKE